MKNILKKDYAGVSAVHFGEWLNRLTNDTISFGTMTAITQLISQIQSPFANITGYLPRFYAMTASAERLTEIESFEDDKDEAMTSGDIRSFYAYKLESIGLRNADFTYSPNVESVDALSKDDQRVVLRNISLEIRKGDYIAFTGHSGCGKSTVLKLLMSIYKLDRGERYVKNSGEKSEILDSKWRRLFAYVPKGNQLMSGTIREVVSFADESGLRDDEREKKPCI